MNYNEFFTRTQVNVSNEEFEAIQVVYMASDLMKDEFCEMWCKMNKTRVIEAKSKAKLQAKRERAIDLCYKAFWKIQHLSRIERWTIPAVNVLNKQEQEAVKFMGLTINEDRITGYVENDISELLDSLQ